MGNKNTKDKLHLILRCRHEIAHQAFCRSEELTDEVLAHFTNFFASFAKNIELVIKKELYEL